MGAAEPRWQALERYDTLATAYRRYDFLKLWQRHVGADSAVTPFYWAQEGTGAGRFGELRFERVAEPDDVRRALDAFWRAFWLLR
jgi:hypothetical protein